MVTTEELQSATELLAVMDNPVELLSRMRISDPLGGGIKFIAWGWQPELVQFWHSNKLTITLKARQLGVSWLAASYALWTAMYHDGANVIMLSKREEEAKKLLSKAKYIYDNLPTHLKPKLTRANDTLIRFGGIGSEITAFPSTEDAGRSEAATLVVVDEAAFHPYADKNYGAYKPSIDAGGRLMFISTANARGDLFHRTWLGSPENGFSSKFLKWDLRPGRDTEWYERQKREYAATPEVVPREYPSTPEEAFQSSSNCVFDIEGVTRALEGVREPLETRLHGQVKVWQRPVVGRHYVAGADVAEGLEVGSSELDYSGAAIYDWQTLVHVADLHGRWPMDVFAKHLADICREYNNAFLGVERNNHGHAVIMKLRELRYSNLYFHTDVRQGSKGTRQSGIGWPTNLLTKPIMETDLNAAIQAGSIISYDRKFWDECLSYVHIGNGRSGAEKGCHDDRCIKHMIALQVRRRYRPQRRSRQFEFAVQAG